MFVVRSPALDLYFPVFYALHRELNADVYRRIFLQFFRVFGIPGTSETTSFLDSPLTLLMRFYLQFLFIFFFIFFCSELAAATDIEPTISSMLGHSSNRGGTHAGTTTPLLLERITRRHSV